jgi:hypothetical protein
MHAHSLRFKLTNRLSCWAFPSAHFLTPQIIEMAPLQLSQLNWIGAGPFILNGKIIKKNYFLTNFNKFALHLEGTGSSPGEFNRRGSFFSDNGPSLVFFFFFFQSNTGKGYKGGSFPFFILMEERM